LCMINSTTTPVNVSELTPDLVLEAYCGDKIESNEIEVEKEIGCGGFAQVYLGNWRGMKVAVKELKLRSDTEESLKMFAEFRREVLLLSYLKHPNIVGLKGVIMKPFSMILEYMSLGSLYDFLHNVKAGKDVVYRGTSNRTESNGYGVPWIVRLGCAYDIGCGLEFLHSVKPKIIHRDLKSPNILLTEACLDSSLVIVAKVADFGTSRQLMFAPVLKSKVVHNPVWLAPEVLKQQKYTEKIDVYSFGVILWELLTFSDFMGELQFMHCIEDAVLMGKRPLIPLHLCPPVFNPALTTALSQQAISRLQEQTTPDSSTKQPEQHAPTQNELPQQATDIEQFIQKLQVRQDVKGNVYAELIQKCWHQNPHKRPSFTQIRDTLHYILQQQQH